MSTATLYSNVYDRRHRRTRSILWARPGFDVIDAAESSATAAEATAPVATDAANLAQQLSENADVFWLPRRAGRVGRGIAYRRFETLAEAVTFAVETIPNAADIRIYTGRGPIAQRDVPGLYRATTVPLQ
ncbi:MAG: hypothetical protein KIT43_09120 [Bauldia sp.]|nr:hypothetical protein [Bauldia sp.]MCW5717534.1 hypothetical protein [Bauldia sp.]